MISQTRHDKLLLVGKKKEYEDRHGKKKNKKKIKM